MNTAKLARGTRSFIDQDIGWETFTLVHSHYTATPESKFPCYTLIPFSIPASATRYGWAHKRLF